jgi:hypothetical protein
MAGFNLGQIRAKFPLSSGVVRSRIRRHWGAGCVRGWATLPAPGASSRESGVSTPKRLNLPYSKTTRPPSDSSAPPLQALGPVLLDPLRLLGGEVLESLHVLALAEAGPDDKLGGRGVV